jgi:hypothetical protein
MELDTYRLAQFIPESHYYSGMTDSLIFHLGFYHAGGLCLDLHRVCQQDIGGKQDADIEPDCWGTWFTCKMILI